MTRSFGQEFMRFDGADHQMPIAPLVLSPNAPAHCLIVDAAVSPRLGATGRRSVAKLCGNDNNPKLVQRLLLRAAAGSAPMVEPGDEGSYA